MKLSTPELPTSVRHLEDCLQQAVSTMQNLYAAKNRRPTSIRRRAELSCESVAKKNYLQITDDHFDQFAGIDSKAKQNAKQYTAASDSTDEQQKKATPSFPLGLPIVST